MTPEVIQTYEESIRTCLKKHRGAETLQVSELGYVLLQKVYSVTKKGDAYRERIQLAYAEGKKEVADIASATGLSKSQVKYYLQKMSLPVLDGRTRQRKRRKKELGPPIELFFIDTIQQMFAQYPRCIKTVQRELEKGTQTLHYEKVKKLIAHAGLTPVLKKVETTERVRYLTSIGKDALAIRAEMEMNPWYLTHLTKNTEVKSLNRALPSKTDRKRIRHYIREAHPDTYRLILRGLTLEEIGQRKGVSRERVRQYQEGTHLSAWRKHSRKFYHKAHSCYQQRKDIVSALHARTQQLLNQNTRTWAEREALLYVLNRRREEAHDGKAHHYPFETIHTLFNAYDEARTQGIKISYRVLAKKAKLTDSAIAKYILDRAGYPSLNTAYSTHFHRLTPEEKERLVTTWRSFPLSSNDLAYFTGRSSGIVQELPKREVTATTEKGKKVTHPQYARASQVYEALDAGFTLQETAEYIKTSLRVVEKVTTKRAEAEPIIIRALQTLYPEQQITKPYMNYYQFGKVLTQQVTQKKKRYALSQAH